jgi:hypothetical protein
MPSRNPHSNTEPTVKIVPTRGHNTQHEHMYGKGVYHMAVKVFNGLPYNLKEISNN